MDVGEWLVEHRVEMDRAEALWLERLVEFDRDGLWELDGQFSCVQWLMWRAGMSRSTAFEKLRVAHELCRRPIVAEAFRTGQLSYSAVRAITRMDRPDPEVDRALVALAISGQASISDIERVVRSYQLYADQDRPPTDDTELARDVRLRRSDDGSGELVVRMNGLELEEVAAALQAFIDLRYRPSPVDESSAGDSDPESAPAEAPVDEAGRGARKADAFMDMVRTALAGADGGRSAGDDRYMVHLVTRGNGRGMSLVDGTPVLPTDAAMIRCDTSTVTHTVGEGGEPLNLSRKSREWSTAQRRAISVRDGGHCRFVGCTFSHYDVHHIRSWEDGGLTDVGNGMCACRRHHRKIHAGYGVQGDPNEELRFYRPDGSYIGSTYPAEARSRSLTPEPCPISPA